MALPKKGSRLIVVGGVRFRWRIRSRPTYAQGAFAAHLSVGVEAAEGGQCVLLIEFPLSRPDNWLCLPASVVKPADVAASIEGALAAGWQPMQPGGAFHCKASLPVRPDEWHGHI